MESYLKNLPDSDKEMMSRPDAKESQREGFRELVRQDARGPMDSIAIETVLGASRLRMWL